MSLLTTAATCLATTLGRLSAPSVLVLAQLAEEEEGGKAYNLSWAIVLLCIVGGMLVTLRASKRELIEDKPIEV